MTTIQFDIDSLKNPFDFNTEKNIQDIKQDLIATTELNNNNNKNINENINENNNKNICLDQSKIVKDRSINKQTTKTLFYEKNSNNLTSTWRSLDSLSVPDSANFIFSASASASTSISDLRSRFETNISDLGTSVETSEDEADTYKKRERFNSSNSFSQFSTGSEALEQIIVYDDEHITVTNDKFALKDNDNLKDNDDFSRVFMKDFVKKIFQNCSKISLYEKALFGEFSQTLTGRLWFARYINEQRNENKQVNETTFYSLAQYFALILFECCEADDYKPARILMNMCFTYCLKPQISFRQFKIFHSNEITNKNDETNYLANILLEQPIWKSSRFWNAAFFDAIQDERETYFFSANNYTCLEQKYKRQNSYDDWQFQANITFGALATFTHNMHSFGLSKQFCMEFFQKQSTIANLTVEQICLIQDNIDKLYQYSN